MKTLLSDVPPGTAALTVGVAFITSVIIVTLVDDFILPNFVVPGDTAALARDIAANPRTFYFAAVGYLLVLVLDSIIALALYIVLKPANESLASLTAILRLTYAGALAVGILLLVFQTIDVYDYASIRSLGYVFFALHVLVLGVSIFRSGYIPKTIGILLTLAALTYAVFFVDVHLPEELMIVIMLTMALSELLLSVWLIARRSRLG